MAFLCVFATGLYFLALGMVALIKPGSASRFLLAMANGPWAHYAELMVRFAVGFSFLQRAPAMLFPTIFTVLGWVFVLTTALLLFIPWQWHRRFAQKTVPQALRYLKLIALSSLALGCFVLVAVFKGSAT